MLKYKCKRCGKEFDELPSPHANGNFCSKYCARAYATDHQRGTYKYLRCSGCGKWTPIELIARSNKVLCEDCKKINETAKETLWECKMCGRPFWVKNVFYESTEYCKDCLTKKNEEGYVNDIFDGITI